MTDEERAADLAQRAKEAEDAWRASLSESDRASLTYGENKINRPTHRHLAPTARGIDDVSVVNKIDAKAIAFVAPVVAEDNQTDGQIERLELLIDAVLDDPNAAIFREIYFNNRTYEEVAAERGESVTYLYRKMELAKRKLERAKELDLKPVMSKAAPDLITQETAGVANIFRSDDYIDKLSNWWFDAKCLAALEWVPLSGYTEADLRRAEDVKTATFNVIMEAMGLHIYRVSGRMPPLIELRPQEGIVASAVLSHKLWHGNQVERWAAYVFTVDTLRPLVPLVDEESFRNVSVADRNSLLRSDRGWLWQRAARDRDKTLGEYLRTERAKSPELKWQKTNWPRNPGFYLDGAQFKRKLREQARAKKLAARK
jgi:hypothetical protein